MVGTVTRISFVLMALAGLTGAVAARDASDGKQTRQFRTMKGFKPSYQTDSRVSGPDRPYTWPVNDRYHPVSQPYFGRAY
jgi:hypothetical protein